MCVCMRKWRKQGRKEWRELKADEWGSKNKKEGRIQRDGRCLAEETHENGVVSQNEKSECKKTLQGVRERAAWEAPCSSPQPPDQVVESADSTLLVATDCKMMSQNKKAGK